MEKNALWYLQNFDFFKDLTDETIKELKDKTTLKDYKKNDFIYFPQEQPNQIFFVKRGKVKIGSYSDNGKDIIKTILDHGEVFGEQFILGEEVRNDFAQAMEDCCLLIMERGDFEKLLNNNNFLSLRVTQILGERLRKLEKKFESLIFKDARSRIVDFIIELAEETGKQVGYETLIMHSLTHHDIARLTATSRQTVTTVLNDLREKNLIYFDRRRILVRDLEKLA